MSDLLAFFGMGRVGKDTMADFFVEHYGYVKLSFAEPLYQEVADAYQIPIDLLYTDEWKSKPQSQLEARLTHNQLYMDAISKAGYFVDEPLTSRQALQVWANDYMKKAHGQDYYAAMMIGRMRAVHGQSVVIPDLRHDIEACVGHWSVSRGKHKSFKIIEVLKNGSVNTGHSSDNGLSRFLVDGTVRNNGTPEECFDAVRQLLRNGLEVRTHG